MPSEFTEYLALIRINKEIGFFLRSWASVNDRNEIQIHRYYFGDKILDQGQDTFLQLVRKSVFISGFTFKRRYFDDYNNSYLDGTLLTQIYILFSVVSNSKSYYFDNPIIRKYVYGSHHFGESEVESRKFQQGVYSISNDLNFVKSYLFVLNYIDETFETKVSKSVISELSKYSYPMQSLHIDKGKKIFIGFLKELIRLGYGRDPYFYAYGFFLVIFGRKHSDNLIYKLRKILRVTPKL
jgi:hypothetical protein